MIWVILAIALFLLAIYLHNSADKLEKSSSNTKSTSIPVNQNNNDVYSKLTRNQKLAAMNLMLAFGGSCSGAPQELSKINHIMTQEEQLMGVSSAEMHAATTRFPRIQDMANELKGVDRKTLERLFFVFFCIIAAGKNEQAVLMLVSIYKDYGFSEQDCISILEKVTGRKLDEL